MKSQSREPLGEEGENPGNDWGGEGMHVSGVYLHICTRH